MNYQTIILVGNVTRDAERRTSQSGEVTYTAFGVGMSDGKDKTTFFPRQSLREIGTAEAQCRRHHTMTTRSDAVQAEVFDFRHQAEST